MELVRVCGADLLVPTRTAAEDCGGILRLNGMDAIFVRRIMEGKTTAELCRFYARLSFRPEEKPLCRPENRCTLCILSRRFTAKLPGS